MAKNTELMTVAAFVLAQQAQNSAFSAEELAEDREGLQLSFQRVKVPSGGGLAFELFNPDDPDDPIVSKTLDGVLLAHHAVNAYWPETEDANDTPPICSSPDGKTGVGYPGGPCAHCAFNAWGSGEGGKGKACKNMRHLYLLRSGEILPLLLVLPPTSLKAFDSFLTRTFVGLQRASWGSLIRVGLNAEKNAANQPYSVCTFRCLEHFPEEKLTDLRSVVQGFKAGLANSQQQQLAQAAEQAQVVEQEQTVESTVDAASA